MWSKLEQNNLNLIKGEIKMELTARSRIKLYWTTDPSFMGYGDNPRKWQPTGKPMITGTPRTILKKWEEEKRYSGLNGGIYYRVALFVGDEQVTWDGIREFVLLSDIEK